MFSIYEIKKVIPLSEEIYYPYLLGKCSVAKKNIWIGMFIISPMVSHDKERKILKLLRLLIESSWNNIDVRVIIGTSISKDIQIANEVAMQYIDKFNVPIRRYKGDRRGSFHSKYIIIDNELVILGSHNWTPFAISNNIEDSVAIYSSEINQIMKTEFISLWERGE
ncbi:MAG: phosphatidylserine/phosphatidylglycerophosphate/cardiolipin synthase family protein [Promethearchaeota archaeon]